MLTLLGIRGWGLGAGEEEGFVVRDLWVLTIVGDLLFGAGDFSSPSSRLPPLVSSPSPQPPNTRLHSKTATSANAKMAVYMTDFLLVSTRSQNNSVNGQRIAAARGILTRNSKAER